MTGRHTKKAGTPWEECRPSGQRNTSGGAGRQLLQDLLEHLESQGQEPCRGSPGASGLPRLPLRSLRPRCGLRVLLVLIQDMLDCVSELGMVPRGWLSLDGASWLPASAVLPECFPQAEAQDLVSRLDNRARVCLLTAQKRQNRLESVLRKLSGKV
jgi:hypothetical protein